MFTAIKNTSFVAGIFDLYGWTEKKAHILGGFRKPPRI